MLVSLWNLAVTMVAVPHVGPKLRALLSRSRLLQLAERRRKGGFSELEGYLTTSRTSTSTFWLVRFVSDFEFFGPGYSKEYRFPWDLLKRQGTSSDSENSRVSWIYVLLYPSSDSLSKSKSRLRMNLIITIIVLVKCALCELAIKIYIYIFW